MEDDNMPCHGRPDEATGVAQTTDKSDDAVVRSTISCPACGQTNDLEHRKGKGHPNIIRCVRCDGCLRQSEADEHSYTFIPGA